MFLSKSQNFKIIISDATQEKNKFDIPIINKIMDESDPYEITIMIQKEVALRFAATPHTRDYSSISVFLQYSLKKDRAHIPYSVHRISLSRETDPPGGHRASLPRRALLFGNGQRQ